MVILREVRHTNNEQKRRCAFLHVFNSVRAVGKEVDIIAGFERPSVDRFALTRDVRQNRSMNNVYQLGAVVGAFGRLAPILTLSMWRDFQKLRLHWLSGQATHRDSP